MIATIAIGLTKVVMIMNLVPEADFVKSVKLSFLVASIVSTAMGICIEVTTGKNHNVIRG